MTGLWAPAQAGSGRDKKCDSEESSGSGNSRKNCPTTTTTSSTTTTSTTTTTMMPPTLQDTVVDVVDSTVPYERTYPDLVPNVTDTYITYSYVDFNQETGEFIYGPPVLAFDTVAQNFGQVAVDIQSDDLSNQVDPPASQCVAWTGLVCRERERVGGFEIHPGHNHIHFHDFAKYELRKLVADGTPDFSSAGLVAISDKVSFCLLDLMKIRDDAVPVGTYNQCTAVREGISAGWADVYSAELPGQTFPLAGVPDGRYAIMVAMNYTGSLFETDHTNNRVAVTVDVVTGATPSATIVDRAYL